MLYDVGVDINNLDEESVYLPAAFDAFQSKESEVSAEWDALKDQMKVLQADVSLEIRGWEIERINSFFQLNLNKLTEEVYKQLVFIHPAVIDLYRRIEEIRRDVLIYQAARKSIERKAESLDRLARLHGQGYFMKVEARPYKKMALDPIIEKLKSTIIRRLKEEENIKPKSPEPMAGAAKKTLKRPIERPK